MAFSASPVTGAARAAMDWVDQSGLLWVLVGTHSGLYVYDSAGDLFNITPSGLVTGNQDATNQGGYGGGVYGSGEYGNARGVTFEIQPATVWTMDTLEQTPYACNAADGKIYSWNLNTADAATLVANSPVNNRALFVTQEGFLVALGASGDPRAIKWTNQDDPTNWTPGVGSQADSYELETAGIIMCGVQLPKLSLIFTTTEVHQMLYLGLPLVYSFNQIGSKCGIVSQAAFSVIGENAVAWMGVNSFWTFDGATVSPLESDVADFVFSNMNKLQVSKIWAFHNAAFSEVTWFYVSAASTEIDSYVTWNYLENHWNVGRLTRLCGVEAGVFPNPLMLDGSGNPWVHESGFAYNGEGTPEAETGPIEFDQTFMGDTFQGVHPGTSRFDVINVVPDTTTDGDGDLYFLTKEYPEDAEATVGPFAMSALTNVRFSCRQARLKFVSNLTGADWRFGVPRLDCRLGGQR